MWEFVAIVISLSAVYYVKQRSDLTVKALEDMKKLAEETKTSLEGQVADVLDKYGLQAEVQTRITEAAIPSLLQMMVDNPANEKRLEIDEDERIVMGHQLDRLHKWTMELAGKIGHTLNP